MGPALRFSQCAMRSVKRLHAQPTPPSSRPKRSMGKRFTTPPKTSARAKAWLAAAKWPMWLKLKLLIDSRPCQPMLPECAVTATFRSTHARPNLLIGVVDVEQPERGVEQAEVDAEVVEPLVEEFRHHGGGPVERVARLAPPRGPERPLVQSLLAGHRVPAALDVLALEVLDERRPADLLQVVEEDRHWLEPVAVAVDDRVVELPPDLRGLGIFDVGHGLASSGSRPDRARAGRVSQEIGSAFHASLSAETNRLGGP